MVHLCAEPPVRGLFKLQRAPLVPMWSRGGHGLESELPTGLAAAFKLGPNIAMKRVFSVKIKLRSKKRLPVTVVRPSGLVFVPGSPPGMLPGGWTLPPAGGSLPSSSSGLT
jgi:hypothetical protein